MSKVFGARAAASFLVIASPLAAQAPAPSSAQPQKAPGATIANPDQIICERHKLAGSRLATKRVCLTRAQWADLRLQDRQDIERVQMGHGIKGQ